MSSGLMKPTPKQSDLMKDIKRAFGPVSSTPVSLEQQLLNLNESELNLVLTTAQLVKMAHGFKAGNTQSYSSLVTSMYPNMKPTLRSLIAKMLQDADPVPDAVEAAVTSPRVDPREQVLSEYMAALSQRPTDTLTAQTEKQANPALQDEVAAWHIADLDEAIDALGDAAKGYDRDGLRSIGHLGGKGGMRKYVKSGGKYNPSDELGTSLKDYYDKFSSKT